MKRTNPPASLPQDEFQLLDRHSFGCFLGLHSSQKVLDATTTGRFREDLVKASILGKESYA